MLCNAAGNFIFGPLNLARLRSFCAEALVDDIRQPSVSRGERRNTPARCCADPQMLSVASRTAQA